MSDLPRMAAVGSVADQSLVTTAETIVATLPPIPVPSSGGPVAVIGQVDLATGVAATGVQYRIRRGTTLTSPLVGEGNTIAIGASTTGKHTHMVVDNDAGFDAVQYCLTVQQVSATGNGSVVACSLLALVQA